MQITEKWLGDIGGWQAMKAAREMVRLGAVADVVREGDMIKGLAGDGRKKFRAALIVKGERHVDAKCGCPDAQRGLICAHALAVALVTLQPVSAQSAPSPPPRGQAVSSQGPLAAGGVRNEKVEPTTQLRVISGHFTAYLPWEQLWKPRGGNSIPLLLKYEPSERGTSHPLGQWLQENGLDVKTQNMVLTDSQIIHLFTLEDVDLPLLKNRGNGDDKLLITRNLNGLILIKNGKIGGEFIVKLRDGVRTRLIGRLALFEADEDQGGVLVVNESDKISQTFVNELFKSGIVDVSSKWVAANFEVLRGLFGDEFEDLDIRVLPAQPIVDLCLDGSLRNLKARLRVILGSSSHELLLHSGNACYPHHNDEEPNVYYVRNLELERAAQDQMLKLGFSQVATDTYEMKGEGQILNFYMKSRHGLGDRFRVVRGEQWKTVTQALVVVSPLLKPQVRPNEEPQRESMNWLEMEVGYEGADGFRVPRHEVLRLIRSGGRDVASANGRRYILDVEECEDVEDLLRDSGSRFKQGGQRLEISPLKLGSFDSYISDQQWIGDVSGVRDVTKETAMCELGDLGHKLRPYQMDGVCWLAKWAGANRGGLLADEMGLGKTIQSLALLRMACKDGKAAGPALVVCPTSLLGNWSAEAQQFVPELKVFVSHEAKRKEHLEKLHDYDVIITSYALVVRDLNFYLKLKLSIVILDEASYIRNPDSETFRAVSKLPTATRFALTGTPVENSVKDLWSVFQFILPGYLPRKEDFHENFVKPLSQASGEVAGPVMNRLRRLIRPYMLRRTKRDVAKDLPEKIERVVWCELTPAQKEVYTRLLEEGQEEIRQARRRTGGKASRMTMFTVLLRLRQLCNDLKLLKLRAPESQSGGKWASFDEMVQELVEGGHKALIFSQFVGMLHLVRDRLQSEGHTFSYLDGGSRDRAEQVAAFQKEPNRRFFLISLKAGGYGLNLTAADHVLLMDPWWNPAVEAQAIDRAHRIGQGRTVNASRFIMRGTVEEKILRLQERKRRVSDLAVEDDAMYMAGISDTEMEELLTS